MSRVMTMSCVQIKPRAKRGRSLEKRGKARKKQGNLRAFTQPSCVIQDELNEKELLRTTFVNQFMF